MPTKELESVLHREISKAIASPIIAIASPLLQELVNYSTWAYMRCATSTSEEYVDRAPLTLFLHVIEMTDSIEVLITQSCPSPAFPLLRSSFEALLFLEYKQHPTNTPDL